MLQNLQCHLFSAGSSAAHHLTKSSTTKTSRLTTAAGWKPTLLNPPAAWGIPFGGFWRFSGTRNQNSIRLVGYKVLQNRPVFKGRTSVRGVFQTEALTKQPKTPLIACCWYIRCSTKKQTPMFGFLQICWLLLRVYASSRFNANFNVILYSERSKAMAQLLPQKHHWQSKTWRTPCSPTWI